MMMMMVCFCFILHAPLPRQRLVSLPRVVKKSNERNADLSKSEAKVVHIMLPAQRDCPRVRAHETI